MDVMDDMDVMDVMDDMDGDDYSVTLTASPTESPRGIR